MKKILFLFSLIALTTACSSGDGGSSNSSDAYDRTALLTNWANNIIIPSYTNYQAKLQILVTDTNTFTTNPTEVNLQTVRASWLEAYKAFQYVSQYSFGKAEEIKLKEKANTYPTDVTGIEANITAGTYNFSLLSQINKQGFPALDYVLNGLGDSDTEIVTFYTDANAVNYKKYLTDLATTLKSDADIVLTDWNGSYKTAYIANNGKSVTSSLSVTINNFIKNFEKDIRAGKLGIPAGLFSAGTKYPEKVEAYYKNDVSKILNNTAIQAAQDFFNGKYFNSATTGPGLKSYLDYLKTVRSGVNLSTIINNQFTTIFTVNETLSNSFSSQINTDNTKMIAAYDALQQNVVYLKLDMMQALNITIDYVDSDGD
jgi:predicted lipoprotein